MTKVKQEKSSKQGKIFVFIFVWVLFIYPSLLSAQVDIVNGLHHEKQTKPGTAYDGFILIDNLSRVPGVVKIYKTDFHSNYEGKIFLAKPGTLERSNAEWISLQEGFISVPLHDQVKLAYSVKVPDKESLTGSYWSVVMVECVPKIMPYSKSEQDKTNIGIRQVIRYAVQIVTHIEDTGSRDLKFLHTELLKAEGKTILQVDVENTGERWLRPFLRAELYTENGLSVGKFDSGQRQIYPNTSVRYRVDLHEIPAGTYKTLIIVDNKDKYVFGIQPTLRFPETETKD